jgi:gluconolactonase
MTMGTTGDALSTILETTEAERLATGFLFTEGPLWHPDGFYYFVDIRRSVLYRLTPGKEPELVRANTGEGNGATFDLGGRLILCEGGNRRVTRMAADGRVEILVDRFEGKRLNRPNDVVCRSDGSIYFTDPGLRVPLADRELPYAGVYRIAPDGATTLVADCEYPNGLAFSPDERVLYVADNGEPHELLAFDVDAEGRLSNRRQLAVTTPEHPDGLKTDSEGRIYASYVGGVQVLDPSGALIGEIDLPGAVNFAFGAPERNVLYITADTAVWAAFLKGARP